MKLISTLIALGVWFTLAQAECYFPGRTTADRDVPCNDGPGPSACCSEDATCLANGACLNGGRLSRGSCTDINWNSTPCFDHCVELNPYNGAIIVPCPSNAGEWLFACGLDNCSNHDALFTMPSSVANELVLRPAQLTSAVSAAGSTLAAAATNTTDSPVTSTSQPDDATFTAGSMAGVGVGIGVPLLIIIGVLSWLLLREKRKNKSGAVHYDNSYAAVPQGSPQHMYTSPPPVQLPVDSAEMTAVKVPSQELDVQSR